MYVSGVRFDNVTMKDAINRVIMFAQQKKPKHVCTGNLDHLRVANENPAFYDAYWSADLVVADGSPVVWLSAFQKQPLKERVTGVDLFRGVCEAAARSGLRVFLLGGLPGSAEESARRLAQEFPGIKVVGTDCPDPASFYFDSEQKRIVQKVRDAAPHVLFVALGAPKQELWIAETKHLLKVPVSIGVGGAFEMYAGVVKRAPLWMQRVGAEWLFRLSQEPLRLFDRYLLKDFPFLAQAVARAYVTRKTHEKDIQT